jgi:3-hydroxyisobutyrate dehydrogenase-like beta-hydroxyacid dehydrogenase
VPDQPVVGFIGLGDMGGAMARRIIGAGFDTVLWARRPEALDAFAAPNVTRADTPADLAARCDVIGVCVWTDADVEQIVAGEQGLLAGARPGAVIAVHSTVLPATCHALAEHAAAHDVAVLDVPVSGGSAAAIEGQLVVAVGGDAAVAQRCRPVFEAFGDPVLHTGALGSALLAKLVNNTLYAANHAVADDAFDLGEALGIDTETLAEFLRHGSARSFAVDVALNTRTSADIRSRALVPMHKDLLALAADPTCHEHSEGMLITEAATEAVRRLQEPISTTR